MNRHSVPRTEVESLDIKENSTENMKNTTCAGEKETNSDEIINLTAQKSKLEDNEREEREERKSKNKAQILLLSNKRLRKGSLTSECSSSTEVDTPRHKLSASIRLETIWNLTDLHH